MHGFMKERRDYLRLGRGGKRFFFEGFIAQVQPAEGSLGLVGITVTKKLGGSVRRHRAKRRLRETIRLWNKHNTLPFSYDVVLVARSKIFDIDFRQLQAQWDELLQQLKKNQDLKYETLHT